MVMYKDLEIPTFGDIFRQLGFDDCYTADTKTAEDDFNKEVEKVKKLLSEHFPNKQVEEIDNDLSIASTCVAVQYERMGFEIGFKLAVEMLTKSTVKMIEHHVP